MKHGLNAFRRLFIAYLFYPVMVGLFLWLYVKDAHWVFGLIVIVAILILDPLWRRIGRNIVRLWKSRKE